MCVVGRGVISICFNIVPGDTALTLLMTMASTREVSMEPHPFPLAISLLKLSCRGSVCCWEGCGKDFLLQWNRNTEDFLIYIVYYITICIIYYAYHTTLYHIDIIIINEV